jgi:hypothetical protein
VGGVRARGEQKAGRTQCVQAGACGADWLTEPGGEGAAAPAAVRLNMG